MTETTPIPIFKIAVIVWLIILTSIIIGCVDNIHLIVMALKAQGLAQ